MKTNRHHIFVTGIGTDVGKTLVSAILVQALGFDYWKPVQAGNLDQSDSKTLNNLVSRTDIKIHDEYIRLANPVSPHEAARMDNCEIILENIRLPITNNGLIIEGAGGVMVPLNNTHLMLDLIQWLNCSVVIVSKNYLGSINHSVLTFEALKSRNLDILGWVFNGAENKSAEDFIIQKSKLPKLFSINAEKIINSDVVLQYANSISENNPVFAKLFK